MPVYEALLFSHCAQTLLQDINTWADTHPKEILILALSHFKGFDKKNQRDLHNHLIHFIKSLFGNKLLPRKVKLGWGAEICMEIYDCFLSKLLIS